MGKYSTDRGNITKPEEKENQEFVELQGRRMVREQCVRAGRTGDEAEASWRPDKKEPNFQALAHVKGLGFFPINHREPLRDFNMCEKI